MPAIIEKTCVREKKVADVMHRGCVTLKSGATLTDAIWKMKDAGTSCLVIEPRTKGDAYGILTRKDIVEKAVDAGPKRVNFSQRKVYEFMTKPLVTVSPGLKVKYAVRLMKREGVRRLPVFDGKEMVGVISNTDVFKQLLGNGDSKLNPRHR